MNNISQVFIHVYVPSCMYVVVTSPVYMYGRTYRIVLTFLQHCLSIFSMRTA